MKHWKSVTRNRALPERNQSFASFCQTAEESSRTELKSGLPVSDRGNHVVVLAAMLCFYSRKKGKLLVTTLSVLARLERGISVDFAANLRWQCGRIRWRVTKRQLVAHALEDFRQRYGRAELQPAHVQLAKFWRLYAHLGGDEPRQNLEVAATLLHYVACWEALSGDNGLYKTCIQAFKKHHVPLSEAIQEAKRKYPPLQSQLSEATSPPEQHL